MANKKKIKKQKIGNTLKELKKEYKLSEKLGFTTFNPRKIIKIMKKNARLAKKPATKSVQKKGALTKTLKVQDANYWLNRPLNDKERDWHYNESDWITDYVASAEHPHRQLIVDALKQFEPVGGILEIGCNAGPNLIRLQSTFPETQLAGIDVVSEAIERAKANLPKPILKVGNVLDIPFPNKSFDVVLGDAILMYVGPDEIEKAISEINRVAKKVVILVERFHNSILGVITGHVWGRNYLHLLSEMGFKVEMKPITEELWPDSPNWVKYGKIFVASRPA